MRMNHNRNPRRNSRRNFDVSSRVVESNGPEIKIRGSIQHVAEKYLQLARDASSGGDTIGAENYLQHAEHYSRLISAQLPLNGDKPDSPNETDMDALSESPPNRVDGPREAKPIQQPRDNREGGENRWQRSRDRFGRGNRPNRRHDNDGAARGRERVKNEGDLDSFPSFITSPTRSQPAPTVQKSEHDTNSSSTNNQSES